MHRHRFLIGKSIILVQCFRMALHWLRLFHGYPTWNDKLMAVLHMV